MDSQFKDKVAIVTGSSSGIGEAIAVMFASRGAMVTLCGRNLERLTTVFETVVEIGGGHKDRFLIVQGDINDNDVRTQIISKTINAFGRLDILVANAGVSTIGQQISTATDEDYNIIMDTNLKSVFFLIQQAIPHLEKTRGNIVNISSVTTYTVQPELIIYSLAKIGLDHLSRILAAELGPKGQEAGAFNSQTVLGELRQQAWKTRTGTVVDVAELVSFLASEAASLITGQSIKLDGGKSLGRPSE
ncbi:unnamed protein product [Candidula unifasciata]|uniref:Uncharacterized protein n=1 Tax=Candidula unifasciata TaxID=100452 RepID=A0A8S3ZTN4_9EUPU|nr:unnamed protein product [Candidula unifasciata]